MSPTPHPHDPALHLLKQRIRALFKQVPKGLAGDEEAIHQMRVSGRRLRVALPLIAGRPENRRLRRALEVLRQLTRTAGQSRDLDVIAGLLHAHVVARKPPQPEARLLDRRLRQARGRSRHRMAEALLDLEIARLRRDLRRILAWGGADVFSCNARLRQARDAVGGDLLAWLAGLGERYDPEQLHLIRRRARRLRYTAELAAALRGQESEAPALLRELQEQLGAVHDTHVLALWLAQQAGRADLRGQPGLAAEARRLEEHFNAESLQHHRAVLATGPAQVIERALVAMGRARSAA
jgi:CHAD domain-containing protein